MLDILAPSVHLSGVTKVLAGGVFLCVGDMFEMDGYVFAFRGERVRFKIEKRDNGERNCEC